MYSQQQIARCIVPNTPLLSKELADFGALRTTDWAAGQQNALRDAGNEYLKSPVPELPYSLFRLYWATGDRSAFQAQYFERRGRLMTFALLCWLEPDHPRWKTALQDILWAICAEPFWCLPAHFMGEGDAPLDFAGYEGQLDLFACETAFALAEALALCEHRLEVTVVLQVKAQLERRVFTPFLSGRSYRWEQMQNNWSAVCAGGIGGAALYMVQDKQRLAAILHRCLGAMQVYLDSFGDDGVCVEGVDYWTYGFGFFTCFADLLGKASNGQLDLLGLPKAKAIACSQQYYYLTDNHTLSFADGNNESGFRMGLSCYLQQRFPAAALPCQQRALGVLSDTCYRFCFALRDFLWYRPNAIFGLPPERSVFLPDAQWFLSAGQQLSLAAKAGHNGESHNHNDCGSFILYKNGTPALADLGAGQYTAAYFGPGRYSIFVNASRSHNLPLPAGCEQHFGSEFATTDVLADTSPERDSLSMELAGCYACPGLTRLHRRLEHNKATDTLLLTDTFEFESPEPVTEVFVSREPIVLTQNTARFGSLILRFEPATFTATLLQEQWPTHTTDGHLETAYLLHLTCKAATTHRLAFAMN